METLILINIYIYIYIYKEEYDKRVNMLCYKAYKRIRRISFHHVNISRKYLSAAAGSLALHV